jgi:hypothetical protein
MADDREKRCAVCGAPAIGTQVMGCCAAEVCAAHAHPSLLALAPGESRAEGDCYFWRYPAK